MALNLYRRHSRRPGKCLAGRPSDARTYEAEERRRRVKKCACPIYADGTLAGRFKRQNTKQFEWDDARRVAAQWEAAGAWDAAPSPALVLALPKSLPATNSGGSTTISFALDAYVANREARQIRESTLRKHRTFTKQLSAFAMRKGFVLIDQLGPTDLDELYAGWRVGIPTKAKKLKRLKAFFRFCVKRKWIAFGSAAAAQGPCLALRA